jgi:flagellar basal body-associated protein FliL
MFRWSVSKEAVESASQLAAENAADEVGTLEALMSTVLVNSNARKGKEYVQSFVDYEVANLNQAHHDVQRLT